MTLRDHFARAPYKIHFKRIFKTLLVVQWIRICLLMQGTQVRSLTWEDPTCRRATKPMHHNYWACALEPAPQLLKPMSLQPMLHSKRSHCNEKPAYHDKSISNPRPSAGHNQRKPMCNNKDPVLPKISKQIKIFCKEYIKLNWLCNIQDWSNT